ncbi:MAG: ankyrin repeat domain-containing protein [Hyphomonadaceae bacterium]|nr:ankyrin repeat domain-containing protein [Hyphomonadaceae bacterium]
MWEAIRKGDHQQVVAYLNAGYKVNTRDDTGRTALLMAAFHGQGQIVDTLVESGANVNAKTVDGLTPLQLGVKAWRQNYWIASTLIEAGADVHASDKWGSTALSGAREKGDDRVILLLMDAGADY